MKFLNKVIREVLAEHPNLEEVQLVLPGKRPVVFIKKILAEEGYSGFLPSFITIEDTITELADKTPIQGIALWLWAYQAYAQQHPEEAFDEFIKWYPTLQKDWDDMMKFSEDDTKVLAYMLDEERIKNWGENLGEDSPRKKNLDFWKKMNAFLPQFKAELLAHNVATSGMLHQLAQHNIDRFAQQAQGHFVFIGFNAFTPVEERLVKALLQNGKASCYFQADTYYMDDERQEAGAFLRKHKQWKEFNEHRPFHWVEDGFSQPKNIKVFEVSGNVSQTKLLPKLFSEIPSPTLEDTALVLLDENLLPATLDALSSVERMNITMGFPLKHLEFSTAIKNLFHIHKVLAKKGGTYYYTDVLSVLENLPNQEADAEMVRQFKKEVRDKNMVYISKKKLTELLGGLSYFPLFEGQEGIQPLLEGLIRFCFDIKFSINDDIVFETVSHFEKSFKIIKNQIEQYAFTINIEALEVLVTHLISSETIDFQGEPLQGLQIMGLLETRLLNFQNIILLSVNEGKLPLGNTQNTYIPFDVRQRYDMHTFLENDGIYAYHFYRLLQGAERAYLLYNGLSSGVNTGEKSRFITQIELESPHHIEEIIIENPSEPIEESPISIPKTAAVMERLTAWKSRVSASHLTAYLYDPIQFYLNYILKAKEINDVEEELSQRNYGNLVHKALEYLYTPLIGKILTPNDFLTLESRINEAMHYAITELKHTPDFYEKGMNYVHKAMAEKVIKKIISTDLEGVKNGDALEILGIEKRIDNFSFPLNDEGDKVDFVGYIDRLDRLNGDIRIIDYKTAKTKNLSIKFKDENRERLLIQNDYKQALQLSIYLYYLSQSEYAGLPHKAGIWSFAEVSKGVVSLDLINGDYMDAMQSVKHLILDILNPDIPFEESEKRTV